MDMQETRRIEMLLDELERMRIGDDGSASEVWAQVVVVVSAINWLTSRRDAQVITVAHTDDILDKLETWIARLVRKLTEIVKDLADGTSFSLSVGTGVSLTITFPPPKGVSA